MRARYDTQSGSPNNANEAFFNEANTEFSGALSTSNPYGFRGNNATDIRTNPVADLTANHYTTGIAFSTATAEALGADTDSPFKQMAFSIEKVTVTAQSRALKAEYSLELAQDLKAIHGLDAETELSNILSTEILAEINREVIRTIYTCAVAGAQYGTTTAGSFDLDTDSNGRWSVERFKGLIFQIERDANVIAKQTRRGKGNVMIVSSDVASAMAMAGVLQYTPNLNADLQVDDTGNTFAGMLHGRIKVYIDPYFGGYTSNQELVTIGYKGTSPYDAGIFYCPYVPLQMVRAIDQYTFQPKIGFKTRYGMVANPFATGLTSGNGALNARSNVYYRIFQVKNLM
jgi:predicted GNAT superfamily acetyltransferase